MTGVVARSSGARRLFIDPSVIQKLVPYWTEDEAKACAKMIYGIVRMRVINGSDPSYEANDFVSCAYEGVIQAKKRYEKEGDRLKVEQCRGYLRSYTAEEVKKKQRKSLDVMDCGKGNLIYGESEAVLEEIKDSEDEDFKAVILDYIQHNHSLIFDFASAFFEQSGGRNALKKTFGKGYDKYRRQFIDAIEAFKDRSK